MSLVLFLQEAQLQQKYYNSQKRTLNPNKYYSENM